MKPSIMGDAPRLVVRLFPALATALALDFAMPGRFAFEGKYFGLAYALGIELAAFGMAFWASAAFELVRAYRKDKLATRGAYALSRNPIFGWWIFSVLPALALIDNCWLYIAVACIFRVVAGVAAKAEGTELGERFGVEYWRYKAATRAFLPLPYLRPLRLRRLGKATATLALLGIAAIAVFVLVARPLVSGLGATAAERSSVLPGDEYVAGAGGYTQAIEIEAPAEEAWKWLIQAGYKRGGWYNVDAINRLAGPDYFLDPRGSAMRIVPELQGIKEGDRIFIAPVLGFTVAKLDPPSLLLLVGDPKVKGGKDNAAWCFYLEPKGAEACRLVVRFHSSSSAGFPLSLAMAVVNDLGGAALQQPAMLWGLKRRAERSWKGALL
jgi:protein-S-isoprenylcysteine O-methyltransferase Ste14